jgi:predicted metalloprotease
LGLLKLHLVFVLALVLVGVSPASQAPARNVQNESRAALALNMAVDTADLNAFWRPIVQRKGYSYTEPNIATWRFTVNGTPQPIAICDGWYDPGAFYCPDTRQVFVDTGWISERAQRYGSYAEVFIWAHEWGHHIQNMLRIRPVSKPDPQYEQQADCYAGVYFRSLNNRGLLPRNATTEAWRLIVSELGDDGRDHGTARERARWFMMGYVTNTIDKCWP